MQPSSQAKRKTLWFCPKSVNWIPHFPPKIVTNNRGQGICIISFSPRSSSHLISFPGSSEVRQRSLDRVPLCVFPWHCPCRAAALLFAVGDLGSLLLSLGNIFFRSTNDLLKALECNSLCAEDEMQKGGRARESRSPLSSMNSPNPMVYSF